MNFFRYTVFLSADFEKYNNKLYKNSRYHSYRVYLEIFNFAKTT